MPPIDGSSQETCYCTKVSVPLKRDGDMGGKKYRRKENKHFLIVSQMVCNRVALLHFFEVLQKWQGMNYWSRSKMNQSPWRHIRSDILYACIDLLQTGGGTPWQQFWIQRWGTKEKFDLQQRSFGNLMGPIMTCARSRW